MPRFTVSQSQVEIESRFEPRLWALVHDTPSLYEALLRNLSPLGLAATDIRAESGDGSIGGSGLGFWLFGFEVNARIRLESFRIQCNSLARVGRSQFVSVIASLTASIEQASRSTFRFQAHTISYSFHGIVDGMKGADFIARSVPRGPRIESLGEPIASGTAIYYGPAEPILSSVITLDPSKSVDGGLFLRVTLMTDGSPKTAEELSKLAEERISRVFSALDLEVSEWWS